MNEEPKRGELAATFDTISSIVGDDEPYWTLRVTMSHHVYDFGNIRIENTCECQLYLGGNHHECTDFLHAIAIAEEHVTGKREGIAPETV